MSTPIVRRRKKAVEVDTIQWTGHNLDEVIDFTGGDFLLVDADEGTYSPDVTAKVFDDLHDTGMYSWRYLHHLGKNQDKLWTDYLKALEQRGLSRDP